MVQAQMAFTDTVSHTAATVYAGTLAGPKTAVRDGKTQNMSTLHAGGSITWTPANWLSLFGVGGVELAQNDTVTALVVYGIRFSPVQSLSLTVGKIATPVTEFRPALMTAASQFEPWTLSRIPGAALGSKVTYAPTKDLSFVAGNFWRGTEASLEFGMHYKYVSVAGYYLNVSHTYGFATDFTYKRFRTAVSYNHSQSVGMFTLLGIPRVSTLSVYSDMGFHPVSGKMLRGEWGFLTTAHIGS